MKTLKLQPLSRRFLYNGVSLPDPDPSAPVEKVRELLANTYPELTTAKISSPEEGDGTLTYTFTRALGDKG
jgi:PRTRC genetic system protein C